jgi:hypothetical protein
MSRVALAAVSAVVLSSGCSSGGSGAISAPLVQPAKVYRLSDFKPAGAVMPAKPVMLSFTVTQPDGTPLTRYRTGPGPHTGVHLIIVRDDLSTIVHDHPPVGPGGRIRQAVTFPAPGRYRAMVDLYPAHNGPGYVNFQLFRPLRAAGAYHPRPIGAFHRDVEVDGYRFRMGRVPSLRVAQAAMVTVTVTTMGGLPARFTPWYGALAHAIFFHKGDLAYFHTHVCAPGLTGCTSVIAGQTVSGSSTAAGVLHVGVLVPEAGTWRLFLQCKVDGHILTAPYTLEVK